VVLVPIHRTTVILAGSGTQGTWAATPGTSSFLSGTPTANQPTVTTNGSS
jgi:hypothetical protein